jgi:5-methylthioadenosine/S-adenosylhomocysteine deaminase
MALVLAGRCIPCAVDDPDAVFDGRVYITDDGHLEKVVKNGGAAPAGFASATVLDVKDSYIVPGLIDLHNHIGYNTLPLWTEPSRTRPYDHHDSWPGAPSYRSSISLPQRTLVACEPEALLAYVQLRALVGGTTCIQGWPGANRGFVQVLRNADDGPDAAGTASLIQTSVLTLQPIELAKRAQAQKRGAGFIYHCGEGAVDSLVTREFTQASQAGCLQPNFIGIHCNAISKNDWKKWPRDQAGAVVWSPFSNLWLYGQTTDVPAAREQGVLICIGSDWGPSGTKNVQGELKVARLVNEKKGFGLTDRDLFAAVTSNPGDALARSWQKTIGRLVSGSFADIAVIKPRGATGPKNTVWTQLVRSRESDIALVIVNGKPRYGDDALMQAAGVTGAALRIDGKAKRFAIPKPEENGGPWGFKDFSTLLKAVIADPEQAIIRADARMRAYAGPIDAAEAPLILSLDMPSGGAAMAGPLKKFAKDVVIPPLASLVHDKAFFASIKGRGFHAGLLDGLAEFYT